MFYFVQQCQSIANSSILSINQIFYTQSRLRDFDIDGGKIFKSVNRLNPNKDHVYDRISIRMVKLFNLRITKTLSIIYKNCL